MKKIILKSLSLVNFRGEQNRTTEFDAKETSIMGDNGLGKSRHFDAFMWLLFGKDVMERKDYEIKTIVDGKPLQHVNAEVTGVLVVDGEVIKLRRALVEDWVKPRGQMEQIFKGNHTECAVNDVPMPVTKYKAYVNGIVDDGLFKIITNPLYFASMPWQKQREQLFALAGTISDSEIAEGNEAYTALLAKLVGKDMEGYKKEVAAKKKLAKDELEQIQPRIDQTQKLMPPVLVWEDIEKKIGELDAKILEIDTQLQDKAEAERKVYEAERKKKDECNAILAKQSNVLFNAKQAAKEAAFKKNAERREAEQKVDEAKTAITSAERKVALLKEELNQHEGKRAEYVAKMEELRNKWHEENARTYTGQTICPHCGQPLPEHMIATAEQSFKEEVQKEKSRITAKGQEYKGFVAKVDVSINETKKAIADAQKALDNAKAESDNAVARLNGLGAAVEPEEVKPESIEEWVKLKKEYEEIHKTIAKEGTSPNVDNTALNEEKRKLVEERDNKRAELATKDTIEKGNKAIGELEESGKKLAAQIAEYEKEEFIMEGFTKAKINECENRINGLFTHVTFKLYDYTLDGNAVETCVPLVNGIPFFVANTAGRINAGLDIINALCRFYNVSAPIFIDSRESVNTLIPTDSQIINLVVSHDKEIVVK